MNTCSFLKANDARMVARDVTRIYSEICGIQKAILHAIDNKSYSATISNNTPMTALSNVESVTVVSGGLNYFNVSAIAEVNSNTGSNALLIPIVTGQTITGFNVVGGGQNYLAGDTIDIIHPTGFGFQGTLLISAGVITGVNITDGGLLYNEIKPTAQVVDSAGIGAELQVVADPTTGTITEINVIKGGFGYTSDASVEIFPAAGNAQSGAGANAIVTVNVPEDGFTSAEYYAVISGQSHNRVILDQLEFVQAYFTKLGYKIRAQVNPITGNTLQWSISW